MFAVIQEKEKGDIICASVEPWSSAKMSELTFEYLIPHFIMSFGDLGAEKKSIKSVDCQ